jgi:hypothetical protein
MNGADADAKHKEEEEDRRARRKVGQRLRENVSSDGFPACSVANIRLTSAGFPCCLDRWLLYIGGEIISYRRAGREGS